MMPLPWIMVFFPWVGALVLCLCVLIVAALYAAPEGHQAARGLMG
jgi:hypothetical protein